MSVFTVDLTNQPGELARLCEAMAGRGVNLILCAAARGEDGMVAFIAGRSAPPDKKMGHAGAIVSAGRGSYASKRAALEKAGVQVADIPAQIPQLLSARPRSPESPEVGECATAHR